MLFDHIPETEDLAAEMITLFIMQGAAAADLGVGVENDSGLALQPTHAEIDALLGDAIARDAEEHQSPGLRQLVVHIDLIPKTGQVARCGQARWSGADDADTATIGHGRFGTEKIEIDRVHVPPWLLAH